MQRRRFRCGAPRLRVVRVCALHAAVHFLAETIAASCAQKQYSQVVNKLIRRGTSAFDK